MQTQNASLRSSEQQHDRRALVSDVYVRYYADLKRFIISYTHDEMTAEDMLQDVFLKLMTIDTLTEDTIKSLLFITAKCIIVDDARHKAIVREHARQLRVAMECSYTPSDGRRIEAADLLNFERHHLEQMPAKRARVYKMYKHDELSTDEIAQKLQLNRRTVESHIYWSTRDMKAYLRRIV